jgi:hypothetical protein
MPNSLALSGRSNDELNSHPLPDLLLRNPRWGIIEEGQPPKQIIEDGEYFTLKRVEGGGHH